MKLREAIEATPQTPEGVQSGKRPLDGPPATGQTHDLVSPGLPGRVVRHLPRTEKAANSGNLPAPAASNSERPTEEPKHGRPRPPTTPPDADLTRLD